MKFLIDANVLSEVTRPAPDPKVVAWLGEHSREVAVDPVVLGEIQYGILLLPKGKKRSVLETWFAAGVGRIHCFPWERETGLRWAQLLAQLKKKGTPMPIKDSMIAATALAHGLVVVTRNTKDFHKAQVATLDPFE